MATPNCLCKLKHFTFYLRDLVLERAEWENEKKNYWPMLHDLIAITTLCCLKNEGFKCLKKNRAFGWMKYNDTYLREFRKINGHILITTRLNGFTKFIIVFLINCVDGGVQLRGQIHNSDDTDLDYYEMKVEKNVAGSIHFALCGGYYLGQPVYLQYDIPRLLKSIYDVIEPIKEHVTQNWQFNSIMSYIKHLPLLLTDALFGDKDNEKNELDEINGDGKFKIGHTNPENLIFLSQEMSEAQIKAQIIIYHYRDNEKMYNAYSSEDVIHQKTQMEKTTK